MYNAFTQRDSLVANPLDEVLLTPDVATVHRYSYGLALNRFDRPYKSVDSYFAHLAEEEEPDKFVELDDKDFAKVAIQLVEPLFSQTIVPVNRLTRRGLPGAFRTPTSV